MIEAALVFGLIIFAGIAFILIKLPRRKMLWLLGHHVALDITVTVAVLWMHFGTITGLMSATVAGIICSLTTSFGRWLVGYIKGGRYYPGMLTLDLDHH